MSKIFISYRRDDSSGYAGRLFDKLEHHFGKDQLFMDIDLLEAGEDFAEVIQQKLQSVQVAMVLIGKHWLVIRDSSGRKRLDNPDDWVRLEIATLLERKIRVIPVLVGGAQMPLSSQLPKPLESLARRHAHEISDIRFHSDVDKLIQILEKTIGNQDFHKLSNPAHQQKEFSLNKLTGVLVISMLILLAGGLLYHYSDSVLSRNSIENETSLTTDQLKQKSEKPASITYEALEPLFDNIQKTSDQLAQAIKALPPNTSDESQFSFEPQMVRIPPGSFIMGSPESETGRKSDESPQRKVTIAYPFEIGRYEVTFAQYDAFSKDTNRKLPSDQGWGRDDRPVISVSWDDAQAYVQWLVKKTGKKYRLPTEAEWEYVARAGTSTAYWWGDVIGQNNAVCNGCGSQWDNKQTAPVGSFKPNAFGVYDTAGNVWEWTQDCWHGDYTNAPLDGTAWLERNGGDCSHRVVRGGSWVSGPRGLRSADRYGDGSGVSNLNTGFRVARDF
ncbi:MAG: SUMF1/EgtB/PvdO family nonheme iron enzyme [Nitrosomonas sp.]|nr:SUMF1/EgtB/PvdO family nonheme iron enzyme [Nitrosomonas sp.]MBK7364635.1 SUMF1/EgtB/PvdO family nonheme iron enzyme [Nitrosomonas sp.]